MPFIISGIGMGLFFAPMANVTLSAVRPQEEGQASGASNAIRELGGVFGVAVLAAVFARNGSYASPHAFVDGMVPAVFIGAVFVAVGAAAAFAIPRKLALLGAMIRVVRLSGPARTVRCARAVRPCARPWSTSRRTRQQPRKPRCGVPPLHRGMACRGDKRTRR